MSDLEKQAALFVPSSDDFDTRFFDGSTIPFDPLSDLEPSPKRPRPAERGEFEATASPMDFGELLNSRIRLC